ncbi:MAG: hypothetical protein ABR955_16080, partial [Verrucomicrobiota bacterium]
MPLEDSKLPLKAKFRYEGMPQAEGGEPPLEEQPHLWGIVSPHDEGAVRPIDGESAFVESMSAKARGPEPVAIIVFHGMGEQVRYETLGDLAKALLREADAPIATTVTMARPANSFVARAEIRWRDKQQVEHEVHLYEAYWAPLTEGKVTYVETLKFLFGAAWSGIRHSRLGRVCQFQRWMFGGVVELD